MLYGNLAQCSTKGNYNCGGGGKPAPGSAVSSPRGRACPYPPAWPASCRGPSPGCSTACSTSVPLSLSMPPIWRSTMNRWGTEKARKTAHKEKEAFLSKEAGSRGRIDAGLSTIRSRVDEARTQRGPSLTLHPPLSGSRLAEPRGSPAPPCSLEQDPGLLCGAAAGGGVWESGGPDGTSADGCVLFQGSFGVREMPIFHLFTECPWGPRLELWVQR